MAYSTCRRHARCGILFGLCLLAVSAGAHLLSQPVGLVTINGSESSSPSRPVEVPHDGVRALQPFDAADLASCESGSGTSKKDEKAALSQTFNTSSSRSSSMSSAVFTKTSIAFLHSHGKDASHQKEIKKKTALEMRRNFICDAGCSAQEPELESSLSPWADWNQNSSGLDMIDALLGFCKTKRESTDPFLITVLWKESVWVKSCSSTGKISLVSQYLIGPEDLSLALVFLLGVQRVAPLPAGPIAFGMYLSDYTSLLDHHLIGPGLPIFAYLGRDTSWVIPFPSSFTVMSTQESEWWEEDEAKTKTQKPWENRESKAYWIGAVTGPWDFVLDDAIPAIPRMKMLKMATDNPKELQAEWSSAAAYGISWVKSDEDVSGFLARDRKPKSIKDLTGKAKSDYKSVKDWEDFKYYVNLDGVVLGGRFNKLLSLGGVVLQHQAGYREHLSALAKPYEHYVPIEYDLSDLVEKVKWLQNNDAQAKRIAENGKALADKRMRFEDHVCYIWRALEALGTKTAATQVSDEEVRSKLSEFTRAQALQSGMRDTMEEFWGQKLEQISTGERVMSSRGIQLLDWAWTRMEGLWGKVHGHV